MEVDLKNILLTIGIPVFNGEQLIQQTLDSIKYSMNNNLKYHIEILISDNCSTDNTEQVISEYIENNKLEIEYYKNDSNYGYDGNIDLIAKRANGKYIWFLGCGEIIKQGALSTITEEISKDSYDNILLNFDIYSEKTEAIEVTNNFNLTENIVFDSKDEFLKNTKTGVTPISANIILKSSYNKIINSKLLVNGWVHVERIISILSNQDYNKSLWLSTNCFTLHREIDGWWSRNGNLFINSINLIYIFNKKIDKSFNKTTHKTLMKDFDSSGLISKIITAKKQNIKITFKLLKNCISLYYFEPIFWFVMLPLLLIPNFIYTNKFIKLIFKKIKK